MLYNTYFLSLFFSAAYVDAQAVRALPQGLLDVLDAGLFHHHTDGPTGVAGFDEVQIYLLCRVSRKSSRSTVQNSMTSRIRAREKLQYGQDCSTEQSRQRELAPWGLFSFLKCTREPIEAVDTTTSEERRGIVRETALGCRRDEFPEKSAYRRRRHACNAFRPSISPSQCPERHQRDKHVVRVCARARMDM